MLDKELQLLKQHRPFTESDHILTHAYNLFLGGSAIEDIANLQCSEPIQRMLGAKRVPDPSTAGDFLRRFTQDDISQFYNVLDETQQRVWRKAFGRQKSAECYLDLDSHVHEIFGNQKEAADFTYTGVYGFHPLIASFGQTQEVLRIINHPGNEVSASGAPELLDELLPLAAKRARRVIVRGDAAFAENEIFEMCEDHKQSFAIVAPERRGFAALAESILQSQWQSFRQHAPGSTATQRSKKRKRGKSRRRKIARNRGKRDLRMCKQWVTELEYEPLDRNRSP